MKPDKLISNETLNHNSNNISENLNIESENNKDFKQVLRKVRINNGRKEQTSFCIIDSQSSTSSNHNWNKVKCLLT